MIAFLIGCTISITLSYFFSRFYRLKYSTSISLIIFLVSLILISICNYKSLNIVGNMIIGIGYVFLQFEGTFIHKIEHFSLYILYAGLSILVSINCISLLKPIRIDSLYIHSFYPYYVILIFILLLFSLYSYSLYTNINQKYKLPSYSKCILLLPIISLVIPLLYSRFISKFIPCISLLILLISISLIIEHLYIKTILSLHRSHEITLQRYMETSSQNKYNLLNQQYQNSFNILHEIMHKCNALIIEMKNKNYSKVEEELQSITNATFKEFNEIYSNSVVFNTLLSNRKEILKQYNINVSSTIQFNNFDFISFSNQVDLFNTLLDFIIEEAKQSKTNKNIFIKSNMVAGQVILSFRFANNNNKNLENEIKATLHPILKNYEHILSVNNIDTYTTSLLILFQNKE